MLIIVSLSISLHAQEPNIRFQHLAIEDGLSQSSIFSIFQDNKGFMWFGTEDGLNKYDGYSFRVYKKDPKNPDSLSYNYVKVIYGDRSGVLWIGTYGGGLNKFDREKERFVRYQNNPDDPSSLCNNFINSIFEDQSGTLWVGTEDGLNQFDHEKKGFIHYKNNPDDRGSLSDNRVLSVYEDRSGGLWIGTHGGLNRFDQEKKIFTRYQSNPNEPDKLSDNRVQAILEDRSGILWIGTGYGLNKFDREKKRFIHYKNNPNNQGSLGDNSVSVVFEDGSGALWVGTNNGGLNKFDREKEQFICYQANPDDPDSLSSNEVFSIYEDRARLLWIGTNIGLNKLDQEGKPFIHFRNKPNILNSLGNNNVRTIYEDKSGVLWIGTYAGLDKFNRRKDKFIHYKNEPGNPFSLSNNRVMSIYEDRSGMLWVGIRSGGLDRFDQEKERFIHYTNNPEDPNSLSSELVRVVYKDRLGVLWIGTEDGLNKFDREKESFTRYQNDSNDFTSLSNNYIYVIYEDKSGVLWVGTLNGLNRFDREKERFVRYQNNPDDPFSLSNSEVLCLYEDRSGELWIGTPGGLNKFDREKETFTYYVEKDGLPNDLIYDILEDDEGNLWLSTNKGISKFNPRTQKFKNYDVKDGLQSNEFNLGACYKSKSGEMFFGGINGFNAFYPDKIRDNPHIPPVVITDFQISNKSVPIGEEADKHSILAKSITETSEIRLSYRDRVFTFEFAALHYSVPEKNKYAYIMEGFEKEWNQVGNRRFATYTNLPPGDYVFRVKGSNNDGAWNEQGAALKIKVTPPLWQTGWFRGFIILALMLSVLAAHQIRTQTIRRRNKELGIRVEKRTSELKAVNEELQQEIAERKRAEEALQIKQAHLDQLFESAQEAIVVCDNNHRILRINNEFSKVFGYTPEEAIGQFINDIVSSKEFKKVGASYTKQLSDGERIAFESVRCRKDGTPIYISAIGAPIRVGGQQVGYYAIYRDISERKRAEEDIKQRAAQAALLNKAGQRVSSKLELQALLSEIVTSVREAFDYYGVMLLLLDEQRKVLHLQSITGGYVYVFRKGQTVEVGEGMIGYAAASGRIQVSGDVSTDPHYYRWENEKTRSEMALPIKSGDKVIGVLDIQSDKFNAFNDADIASMETLGTQIAGAIENARLYERSQREIIERRRAEEVIKEALKEKEVLLKEIHHRVKNNMQIISSLLRLQSSHIKDERVIDIFKVSQSRIRSMALIHERLYQSEDLARIDFSDYIEKLTIHLFSIFRTDKRVVNLKLEVKDIHLNINQAIPCGLIINELVSNSLKHAFPEGSTGEICVRMYVDEEKYVLIVKDSGIGFPDDLGFRKTGTLGVQIVSDLVRQLDGTIELKKDHGTEFIIKF